MIFGKHINKYYLKYAPYLLLGLVALIVVDYAQLRIPEFYRMVVNGMNDGVVEFEGQMVPFTLEFVLDRICLPMIITIVLMVVCRFLWRIGFFGSAIKVETSLRDEMFDRAKDLSQQYYSVHKVGDLMSLFTNDLETVQDCFGSGILTAGDALLLGGLSFYKMFRMHGALALLSLIPMTLMFIVGLFVGKRMMDKWEERQQKFSDLSDFSQESFTGIAVIKAFAKELKELYAFRKLNKENEDVNVDYVRYEVIIDVSIELCFSAVICVILGYGGYLVHEGVFNAGQLIEFIGYFDSIIWPVLAISILIDMTARGKASLKRISEFMEEKQDVDDSDEVKKLIASHDPSATPDIKGSITFNHLDFTYPGGPIEVLHDMSFSINAGESVGVIGPTGSGKTTVVDLIARTYNVPNHTIFVDGIDVNDIPIKELRRHIAYVPQDNFLFSEKIGANIAFAFDSDDDREAIEEAAKLSDVYDNIMEFPDAFDTVLGERGVTVSGGQKQRISIARALIKDAEILILDDSVSAVDTKTERVILENLKKNREGKTTILIAHRISTVEHMDKIIFIDDGRVVDAGTHEELLSRCKPYAELVEMQRLEDLKKEGKK
ncbi:MAG: ABC transporter ATP-binding protein [Lachnospiraceae bacterium]|nr:ABC transporter ATP-binding protein [Lachnospiraceae bacterium]